MKKFHQGIIFAAIPVVIFILIILFFPLFNLFYFPEGFHGGHEVRGEAKGLISCLIYGTEKIAKESTGINGDYFCGYGCGVKILLSHTCKTGIAVHHINGGGDKEYYIPERGRYGFNFK